MAKSTVKVTKQAPKQEPIANELVEAWKEAFKAENDRDLKLSDKTIADIIDRAGKTWEEMDDAAKLAFLLKAEETAVKVSVSDPGISVLVAKFENDAQAMKELDEDIEIAMRTKVNKVRMYAVFRKLYTKSQLDGMAYPGTDKETPWLGNYKPDKTVTKTNAGEITVVWTDDFVSTFKRGKYLDEHIADVSVEQKAEGASKFYKKWKHEALESEKKSLTSQRNAFRALIRGAIEVHHCFDGILGMPKVHIHWIEAESDKHFIAMPDECGKAEPFTKVTTSPNNIFMCPQNGTKLDYSNFKTYTAGQLTSFDINTAIKNGGTFGDLKATVKKAPKGSNKSAAEGGDGSDMDKEQAYATVNRFANYINKTANIATLRLIFADPKNEHHKDWLDNLVAIGSWADTARKQFKDQIKAFTDTTTEVKEKEAV